MCEVYCNAPGYAGLWNGALQFQRDLPAGQFGPKQAPREKNKNDVNNKYRMEGGRPGRVAD